MKYITNRDIGEVKKGQVFELESGYPIAYGTLNTWIALGWAEPEKEEYYFINDKGVTEKRIHTSVEDSLRKDFGNYFETYEEAEEARDKIKMLLLK